MRFSLNRFNCYRRQGEKVKVELSLRSPQDLLLGKGGWWWKYNKVSFTALSLDVGDWSTSCHSIFIAGQTTSVTHRIGGWWSLYGQEGENFLSLAGHRTCIRSGCVRPTGFGGSVVVIVSSCVSPYSRQIICALDIIPTTHSWLLIGTWDNTSLGVLI